MTEPEPLATAIAEPTENSGVDIESGSTERKSILITDKHIEPLSLPLPPKRRRSTKLTGKKKKFSDTVKTWNNENIITAVRRACKALPFYLWTFFIDALLIPHYRPEWGKYVTWDYHTTNEFGRKKRPKFGDRKSFKLKVKRSKLRKIQNKIPKPVLHNHGDCLTGGMIRRPPAIHLDVFVEEVKFYDLGSRIIATLESNEGFCVDDEKLLPKNLLTRKLWLLFEYPESSYQARIFAYCSILVVCLSVFEFCLGTMPAFQKTINSTTIQGVNITGFTYDDVFFDILDSFLLTETICIVFFVFEFIMRALSCPDFCLFIKDLTNIIDLVAIIPYFLDLLDKIPNNSSSSGTPGKVKTSKTGSLTILRIIRLVRVFRILKLSRHNRGLKILGKTLKASFRELGLLVFFLMIGVIVFSSLMYFAEAYTDTGNSQFTSMPAGFWFSVVTMTTLGYGDLVPSESYGKIIGSLCAIAGVLTISLPVPVIVSNFNMFYSREETKSASDSQYFHVAQCPYSPAWYSKEGIPIGERRIGDVKDGACKMWLFGAQKEDASDPEFEELKSTEVDYKPTKKSRFRSKHTRFLKGNSRSSRKYK